MKEIEKWFQDMVNKGLADTTSTWIERAANQRHPNLTLDLIQSRPMVYDGVQKLLLRWESLN